MGPTPNLKKAQMRWSWMVTGLDPEEEVGGLVCGGVGCGTEEPCTWFQVGLIVF